jgi:hypothetical protein
MFVLPLLFRRNEDNILAMPGGTDGCFPIEITGSLTP